MPVVRTESETRNQITPSSPGCAVNLEGEYSGYIDFNIFEFMFLLLSKIDSHETISGF
jgi:hypothetical protein